MDAAGRSLCIVSPDRCNAASPCSACKRRWTRRTRSRSSWTGGAREAYPRPNREDRSGSPPIAAAIPCVDLEVSTKGFAIVPSDSKTHRNLMIGTVVRDTLKSMKLRYPPPAPEIAGARVA